MQVPGQPRVPPVAEEVLGSILPRRRLRCRSEAEGRAWRLVIDGAGKGLRCRENNGEEITGGRGDQQWRYVRFEFSIIAGVMK